MKQNIGTTDRVVRILIAVVIAVLYFTNIITGTLGVVLLILGGVLLVTSVAGVCPLYLPLGLSTRKK